MQADTSHVLFCIYNNYSIDEYFKQLMQIQTRLKQQKLSIPPKLVFELFVDNIKDFLKGIKLKIIKEMKALGLIQRVQLQR